MTRTQIDEVADAVYSAYDATVNRLHTCNARIVSSESVGAKLLISYQTFESLRVFTARPW